MCCQSSNSLLCTESDEKLSRGGEWSFGNDAKMYRVALCTSSAVIKAKSVILEAVLCSKQFICLYCCKIECTQSYFYMEIDIFPVQFTLSYQAVHVYNHCTQLVDETGGPDWGDLSGIVKVILPPDI